MLLQFLLQSCIVKIEQKKYFWENSFESKFSSTRAKRGESEIFLLLGRVGGLVMAHDQEVHGSIPAALIF